MLENWTYLSKLQFINLYIKYNKSSRKMMKIGKFFSKKCTYFTPFHSIHKNCKGSVEQ